MKIKEGGGMGIQKLTKEQAVIISGFTGILCGEFSDFHADVEKRLGRGVQTFEFGFKEFATEVKKLYEADFIEMGTVDKEQAKAQAVPEQVLENDCMIGQTWFMKGTSVSALIKHAEDIYKAEAVAQNSKIEFGTDDNEHWFAHDVPFYGRAQIDRIEEHGLVEWDIFFNECWQGPFGSKSECIKHLEECIAEERLEAQEPAND